MCNQSERFTNRWFSTSWSYLFLDTSYRMHPELCEVVSELSYEGKLDAFDMLGDYLNDTADMAVTVMHTGTAKPIVDFSRLPRGEIRVRFDVYRRTASETFTHGTVLLDRTHLRRWLSMKGLDYKTFVQELTDDNAIATPASKKAYLGKDTPIKLAQTYVVGVNLSHPRMQGILDEADRDYENLAFGKLAAVPTQSV